jgi:predicted Fe-Mo cluster-binding NifX family protein
MRKILVGIGTGRPGTRIAKHAGRTKHFLIYEIHQDDEGNISLHDKKQIELKDHEILHEVLHRYPLNFQGHPLEEVEIIITGSIGAGAMQKLYFMGKRAYMVEEKDPDTAIEKLMAGTLRALAPENHHHGHHHEHDHSGDDDCGCGSGCGCH